MKRRLRLAKFVKTFEIYAMDISLSDGLKEFNDSLVGTRDFETSSEYVRELIRKDQDRQHLRGTLLAEAHRMQRLGSWPR